MESRRDMCAPHRDGDGDDHLTTQDPNCAQSLSRVQINGTDTQMYRPMPWSVRMQKGLAYLHESVSDFDGVRAHSSRVRNQALDRQAQVLLLPKDDTHTCRETLTRSAGEHRAMSRVQVCAITQHEKVQFG